MTDRWFCLVGGGGMNIIFGVGHKKIWDSIYLVCIMNFTVPAHGEIMIAFLHTLVTKRWKMNHKSLVLCHWPRGVDIIF